MSPLSGVSHDFRIPNCQIACEKGKLSSSEMKKKKLPTVESSLLKIVSPVLWDPAGQRVWVCVCAIMLQKQEMRFYLWGQSAFQRNSECATQTSKPSLKVQQMFWPKGTEVNHVCDLWGKEINEVVKEKISSLCVREILSVEQLAVKHMVSGSTPGSLMWRWPWTRHKKPVAVRVQLSKQRFPHGDQ